jgi:mannose-6-phosphate isomerase-like protein (cupin superfamily)
LLPGEARRIGSGAGPSVLEYATSDLTDGTMTLIETGGTEVGSGPPMHIHHRASEAFFVLSGSYRMHVAGTDYECAAGSFVYLPPGTVHGFYALEPGTRKLNIYAPSSHEGFFDDLDAIMAEGADDERIRELFERHHTEIVGPIPAPYR